MKRKPFFLILCIISSFACTLTSTPVPSPSETILPRSTSFPPVTETPFLPTATGLPAPTETLTPTPLASETASPFASNTALPTVASLKARVTADRLSCRYGPGPEYLYLFAFRAGANIELIGRVDAENWNWVLVENQVPCWISADFIEVQGDVLSLPVLYPDGAKLPITPYYPPSEVTSARRDPRTNEVTVAWAEIPVSLGDYEDDSMQTYIIEVWRCQGGQLIFDPLATRSTFTSFVDEPGCSEPSHGRVWVQEKHGYAGPAEIPWPE
ncbi:MAG TPA: hypothetical protein VIR02_12715 [Anaerolineales bacterium]